jgi:hypothetical protein
MTEQRLYAVWSNPFGDAAPTFENVMALFSMEEDAEKFWSEKADASENVGYPEPSIAKVVIIRDMVSGDLRLSVVGEQFPAY